MEEMAQAWGRFSLTVLVWDQDKRMSGWREKEVFGSTMKNLHALLVLRMVETYRSKGMGMPLLMQGWW